MAHASVSSEAEHSDSSPALGVGSPRSNSVDETTYEFMSKDDSTLSPGSEPLPQASSVPQAVQTGNSAVGTGTLYWYLARKYMTIAQDFLPSGLRRFQEIFRTGSTEFPTSNSPLWLLGVCYHVAGKTSTSEQTPQTDIDQEALEAFASDLRSRLWMTYRRDFPRIGTSSFTSDVGWGCTIRSGQMLLAQALVMHLVGRSWRRNSEAPLPDTITEIISWFGDRADPGCPFGLHALLEWGAAHGVEGPGLWWGPYVFCRTVAAAVNARTLPALSAIVLAGDSKSGMGGAPVLCKSEIRALCQQSSLAAAAGAGEGGSSGGAEGGQGGAGGGAGAEGGGGEGWSAVLLLVPLVLGLGEKINTRYVPLLTEVLTFPQTVGIVGGRPSSSLYFLGCQDDSVFFLDPHENQPSTSTSDPAFAAASYFCQTVRHMPMANIDPSLALGLYCRTREEFEDVCSRLSSLQARSGTAVLLTVVEERSAVEEYEEAPGEARAARCISLSDDADLVDAPPGSEDDWEML